MAFTLQAQSLRSCVGRSVSTKKYFCSSRMLSSPSISQPSPLFGQQQVDDRNQSTGLSEETRILKPLVVCGPSGVGKGTIISNFMKKDDGAKFFGFTVSHTTRQPRPGEINGVHYHFVPYDEMRQAIENNEFLEHADVHGNLYGTSFQSISHVQEQLGRNCLLDIDVQGVQNVKNHKLMVENGDIQQPRLEPKYIFIAPPSIEILSERLVRRNTEDKESLIKRTKNAAAEMDFGLKDGNFDCVIVNDNLDIACNEFKDAVARLYDDVLLEG
eukprot:CAMPEP_0197826194 /NCGR_PEP_ID=MMETSP1437-20131217/3180_1 /TAXON_ID=49252 ORGANISM="Eucampia antarctica, Strain CCMP1452" /NCGR_SAMPLE_ID=MMETSP1437 /ASSEMBLY_ACC=CAM_ASM_001096 /LENGTH=270 /DNA_ID=CAMNT_0043426523 /DNA_START=137 /DNA_END=949 /DNA_ORIENTATION=-